MAESANTFDQWGIVEVMGHKKFAGRITEQQLGGSCLIRVDVPRVELGDKTVPEYSKLIGVGSIYMITPTSEEVALKAATRLAVTEGDPLPVYIPEARQLAAPASVVNDDDDDDDDDFGRDGRL